MSEASARDPVIRLADLCGAVQRQVSSLGAFTPVSAAEVPEPFRDLLDHHSHMTVVMERHHRGAVGLRVLAEVDDAVGRYAREILLVSPDGRVVQFGIVRIDLTAVDDHTAARIRAGAEPLGRILLAAGVLCVVGDVALFEIVPGTHLQPLIGVGRTFGRVANIALDGRPAVELLEVVAGV